MRFDFFHGTDGGKNRNFNGEKLWARGCAVSTVGFELEKIKKHIAQQEKLEKGQEDGGFLIDLIGCL